MIARAAAAVLFSLCTIGLSAKACMAWEDESSQAESSSTTTVSESKPSADKSKPVTVDSVELIPVEERLIELANRERKRHGLPPLAICSRLMKSARKHCAWMTNHQTLRHTSAEVAENIAMGQRSSPQAIGDWMASPGHRANILGANYTRIGASAYRTPGGTVYWCLQFLY
jgi:uncharacterized protein YkwD